MWQDSAHPHGIRPVGLQERPLPRGRLCPGAASWQDHARSCGHWSRAQGSISRWDQSSVVLLQGSRVVGLEEEHEGVEVSGSNGWFPAPAFGTSQNSLHVWQHTANAPKSSSMHFGVPKVGNKIYSNALLFFPRLKAQGLISNKPLMEDEYCILLQAFLQAWRCQAMFLEKTARSPQGWLLLLGRGRTQSACE